MEVGELLGECELLDVVTDEDEVLVPSSGEGSEAVRVGRGIGAKDADDDDSEVTEGDEYDCVSSGLVPDGMHRSGWFCKYVVRFRRWVVFMSTSEYPLARNCSNHSGGRPVNLCESGKS